MSERQAVQAGWPTVRARQPVRTRHRTTTGRTSWTRRTEVRRTWRLLGLDDGGVATGRPPTYRTRLSASSDIRARLFGKHIRKARGIRAGHRRNWDDETVTRPRWAGTKRGGPKQTEAGWAKRQVSLQMVKRTRFLAGAIPGGQNASFPCRIPAPRSIGWFGRVIYLLFYRRLRFGSSVRARKLENLPIAKPFCKETWRYGQPPPKDARSPRVARQLTARGPRPRPTGRPRNVRETRPPSNRRAARQSRSPGVAPHGRHIARPSYRTEPVAKTAAETARVTSTAPPRQHAQRQARRRARRPRQSRQPEPQAAPAPS